MGATEKVGGSLCYPWFLLVSLALVLARCSFAVLFLTAYVAYLVCLLFPFVVTLRGYFVNKLWLQLSRLSLPSNFQAHYVNKLLNTQDEYINEIMLELQ